MKDDLVERKEREVNYMRQECTRLKMMMAEEKIKSGLTSVANESASKHGLLSMRSTSGLDILKAGFSSNLSTEPLRLFQQEKKSPYEKARGASSNALSSQDHTHRQDDLN